MSKKIENFVIAVVVIIILFLIAFGLSHLAYAQVSSSPVQISPSETITPLGTYTATVSQTVTTTSTVDIRDLLTEEKGITAQITTLQTKLTAVEAEVSSLNTAGIATPTLNTAMPVKTSINVNS